MQEKHILRKELRAKRGEHADSLPETMRGLIFRHPPAPLLAMIPDSATIGLYRATDGEAPASAYAGFFHERGHSIALPRITSRDAPMIFHVHTDPFGETDLEAGPMQLLQPAADSTQVTPDVLLVPLVGFSEHGDRLGQGGGYYDRWLADHPSALAIGMAWDCQMIDEIPIEPHDRKLNAVVTPTRFYGPF